MPKQIIQTHQLANGLMLVVEPMQDVQSAAFSFLVPAGCVFDPDGRNGTAAILSDWITRGAGSLSSRELTQALDNLGLQRNEAVGAQHLTLSGATIADHLQDSLRYYAEILLRPMLPADQFEAVVSGAEQVLRAAEDEPQRKAILELRKRSFTSPWGRPSDGTLEDLPSITEEGVREHFGRCVGPKGAILGIAGKVEVDRMTDLVTELFGTWEAGSEQEIASGSRGPQRDFIEHDSAQTHIAISYDSVPYDHDDYYAAWASSSILSGGSSSRLFTEVRERRGLCYSIHASHTSTKHEGRILCYAGTSNERAQETLDVTLQELKKLGEGIGQDELERCKARAKSSLVMQQESTSARSGSIARDWYFLGRITTLQEIRDRIEALTVDSILDYVNRMPAGDFTILTIGPESLNMDAAD